MRSNRVVLSIIIPFLAVLMPVSAFGQADYIRITANGVNIRSGPSTSFPIAGKAWKGDVFELHGKEGRWYKIKMFSANWRYVHKSLAQVASYAIILPDRISTRRKIFKALVDSEDRAEAKADRKYPLENKQGRPISGNVKRNIDYMWRLSDRYKLEVMHKFRVQPPIHDSIIGEGVKKDW